jgi:DNA-binding NtrC family response regulator
LATVLLVDDDRLVLRLCNYILADIVGVQVLQAADGNEAIDVAAGHSEPIHLLISDVVMPGELNGVQLAETLSGSRPEMKVLLMSGVSQETSSLKPDWHFIAKPFPPDAFVSKIEELLGRKRQPQSQGAKTSARGRASA